MNHRLTSAQIAQALAVSESSIKRWCDQGLIHAERTAGGHRRVAVPELIRFLRDSEQTLVHPELLPLPVPAVESPGDDGPSKAVEQALEEGDEGRFRSLCLGLFLDGWSLARICDEVLASAFRRLGDRWQHGAVEIYQERRASEICLRWLHEIDRLLPKPAPEAPRAVGAALAGDWYTLPITMAEVSLREIGWNAAVLGPNLPVETLVAAVESRGPRLFWVSVSYVEKGTEDDLVAASHALFEALKRKGVALVVGGHQLTEDLRQRMAYTAALDDLSRLVAFAEALEPVPVDRGRRGPRGLQELPEEKETM